MQIPSEVVTAVHAAASVAKVADAQRRRDAAVWAWAMHYRRKNRHDIRRYATMADMGRARASRYRGLVPENKVERALLDKAHRNVSNADSIVQADTFVTVLAIHHIKRNPR